MSSHPSLNPHAEAYAEIEEVDRHMSLSQRISWLEPYAHEHDVLVRERTRARERKSELEAAFAKRVKKLEK